MHKYDKRKIKFLGLPIFRVYTGPHDAYIRLFRWKIFTIKHPQVNSMQSCHKTENIEVTQKMIDNTFMRLEGMKILQERKNCSFKDLQ